MKEKQKEENKIKESWKNLELAQELAKGEFLKTKREKKIIPVEDPYTGTIEYMEIDDE